MSVKKQYKELVESSIFKKWKEKESNKECYLAHAFAILGPDNQGEWQFGFYNREKDVMTTFFMNKDEIVHSPETEIFKKEETHVKELNMDSVELDFEQALETAEKLQQEKYKQEKPMKKILILQNLSIGLVWNISFFTEKFNVLNIKIDALNKNIVEQKLVPMMGFASKEK